MVAGQKIEQVNPFLICCVLWNSWPNNFDQLQKWLEQFLEPLFFDLLTLFAFF
jgi:hypothetical protein